MLSNLLPSAFLLPTLLLSTVFIIDPSTTIEFSVAEPSIVELLLIIVEPIFEPSIVDISIFECYTVGPSIVGLSIGEYFTAEISTDNKSTAELSSVVSSPCLS